MATPLRPCLNKLDLNCFPAVVGHGKPLDVGDSTMIILTPSLSLKPEQRIEKSRAGEQPIFEEGPEGKEESPTGSPAANILQ